MKRGLALRESKKVSIMTVFLASGLGIVGIFIWLFAELSEELLHHELTSFDNGVVNLFKEIETSTIDRLYLVITELGSVWFVTTLSIFLVAFLAIKLKDRWGILFFLLSVGGSGALTWLLKQLYQRGRPSINQDIDAIGYSFPSGHSMGSLVFYGFIAYLVLRSNRSRVMKYISVIGLSGLIILIGTSRIYLGAHFPSDVLAGYFAGMVWLTLCLMGLEWVQWQNKSRLQSVSILKNVMIKSYTAGRDGLKKVGPRE